MSTFFLENVIWQRLIKRYNLKDKSLQWSALDWFVYTTIDKNVVHLADYATRGKVNLCKLDIHVPYNWLQLKNSSGWAEL